MIDKNTLVWTSIVFVFTVGPHLFFGAWALIPYLFTLLED